MATVVKKIVVTGLNNDESKKFDNEDMAISFMSTQPVGRKFMVVPSYEVVDDNAVTYRATIVLTVWEHPRNTIAAINSVLAQDTNGWELLILGDCCPELQKLIDSNYFEPIISRSALKGNAVKVINLPEHKGGYGFAQRNLARTLARGKYTLYLDNDDLLLPDHVSTRLAVVESVGPEEQPYDLVGFETWLDDIGFYRDTNFVYGKIGHAEIIIRTEFLKTLPESDGQYGHDWVLIEHAISRGCKKAIIQGQPYSYRVMRRAKGARN